MRCPTCNGLSSPVEGLDESPELVALRLELQKIRETAFSLSRMFLEDDVDPASCGHRSVGDALISTIAGASKRIEERIRRYEREHPPPRGLRP